jgi:hypothetical protein
MNAMRIPVWLISLAGLVLIFVILERLYHAKVPVKIFGIELNQPTVIVPGLKLRVTSPISAKNGETKSLGLKAEEGFCYLTSVSGEFRGFGEYASVYLDNGVWTLHVVHQSGWGVSASAQCVEYSAK